MKIPLKMIFIISSVWIFLISGFILYLIIYQTISFFSGLFIISFLYLATFWQNLSAFRRSGESIGLKSKKQILIISLILTLGFSELFWTISFLPFSFFILSGILAIIFSVVLDIYKEYFKRHVGNDTKIKRILIRDITAGAILIIIFIFISPWLPQKAF